MSTGCERRMLKIWNKKYNSISRLYNKGSTLYASCEHVGITSTHYYYICKKLNKPSVAGRIKYAQVGGKINDVNGNENNINITNRTMNSVNVVHENEGNNNVVNENEGIDITSFIQTMELAIQKDMDERKNNGMYNSI